MFQVALSRGGRSLRRTPSSTRSIGPLMRLYAGRSTDFIQDTTHNQIAERLRTAFFDHYR